MQQRLGIFGGTFDPPHLGHLILAHAAHHQLELDRLLWVLTPQPPHKPEQPITAWTLRLRMLRACLADAPKFEVSTLEKGRPGPHYAVDTLRLFRQEYPGAQLIYLMGGDSLRDLPTWHQPQEFVRLCHELGVMRRPQDQINLSKLESQIPGLSAKVRFIEAPLLEVASHEIRSRIAAGLPVRYYLHPAVYQIIQETGLYRQPPPT